MPQLARTQESLLQADPQTIYWRVEVLGDNQELELHVQNVYDLPAGKAHELWALPEGGAPVSLGLLPQAGEQRRVLTPAQQAALAGAKQIAVSLEPEGGSPTGAPTGPVLLVAPLSRRLDRGFQPRQFRVRIVAPDRSDFGASAPILGCHFSDGPSESRFTRLPADFPPERVGTQIALSSSSAECSPPPS